MRQAVALAVIFGQFLAASVSANERDYIIDIRPLVTDIRKIDRLKPLALRTDKALASSGLAGEKKELEKTGQKTIKPE